MVGEQDAMKTTPARARTARDERHDGAHLDRNGSNIWTLYRAWWPETSAACSCLVPVWCSVHLSILCSPCVVDLAEALLTAPVQGSTPVAQRAACDAVRGDRTALEVVP